MKRIRVLRDFRELRGYDRIDRMGDAPLCVMCRMRPIDARWRPFCSERCRNDDLARWADGRYRVSGEPVPSTDDQDQDQDHGDQ
jgi:endogenous inhibitor of DNA gyrase (YacG/DUF329 family)